MKSLVYIVSLYLSYFFGQEGGVWAPYKHVQPLAQFTSETAHTESMSVFIQVELWCSCISQSFLRDTLHFCEHSNAVVPIVREPCLQQNSIFIAFVHFVYVTIKLIRLISYADVLMEETAVLTVCFVVFDMWCCLSYSWLDSTIYKVPNTHTFFKLKMNFALQAPWFYKGIIIMHIIFSLLLVLM